MQTIAVSTRRLLPALYLAAAVDLGLCNANAIRSMIRGTSPTEVPWLSFDLEATLNAWFTSSMLFVAALLMLWTWAAERKNGARTALGWLLLSIGFLYLSLDEMTAIHEHFGDLLKGPWTRLPIFKFRWVLVGIPIVVAVAVVFLPFLLRLPRRTAIRLAVAGVVYVGAALGIEMIDASVFVAQGDSFSYQLLVCIEESLELVGVLLGIRAVALHLETELAGASLALAPATP